MVRHWRWPQSSSPEEQVKEKGSLAGDLQAGLMMGVVVSLSSSSEDFFLNLGIFFVVLVEVLDRQINRYV